SVVSLIIFFFQAEDGIRDRNVTGVQTCALPISLARPQAAASAAATMSQDVRRPRRSMTRPRMTMAVAETTVPAAYRIEKAVRDRSEERRVGKEWRARGAEARWKRRVMGYREGGQ